MKWRWVVLAFLLGLFLAAAVTPSTVCCECRAFNCHWWCTDMSVCYGYDMDTCMDHCCSSLAGGGCGRCQAGLCPPAPTPTPTPKPPQLELTATCEQWGAQGWCLSNGQITATGIDPEGGNIIITGTTGGPAPQPLNCSGAGSCTTSAPMSPGAGTASARAEAIGGTASQNLDWKYDPLPPLLEPSMPSPDGQNGWFVTAPVQVDASGSDAISGLAMLECRVDGGAWQAPPVAVSGDGTHTVECRAQDQAGNLSSWSETVQIDTTPPEAHPEVNGTLGENGWYTSQTSVSANPTDAVSGVATVEFQTNDGPWQSGAQTTLEDGVHTVRFRVVDRAGNVTTTPDQTIHVDTTPPLLEPSMPSPDGQNGWFVTAPVQVDASGSDATSGLAALECRVDGGAWQAPPVAVSGDGTHTVECRAQDQAGNLSSWSETVQIDTTAPELNPSMPSPDGQNGWFVTAPVQVDASGSDATSGLATLECRVDGGAWQAPPVAVSGDGTHTVECRAQDQAGNLSSWSETVQIDTTAPNSIFLYPPEGAVVWGIVTLRGESHDVTSGVAAVEISTDAGTDWQPASLSDPEWMASWNTQLLPDGTYTLMARAQDKAGNKEHTAVIHVTVANRLPKVSLHPGRWPFWETARVHVQANPYTPVKRIKITIIDTYTPGQVRVWEYRTTIRNQETFLIKWDGRWFSEYGPAARAGEYTVKVQVWDNYGRQTVTTGEVVVPPPSDPISPTPTVTPTISATFTLTPSPTPTSTPTPVATRPNPTPTATIPISRPLSSPTPSPVPPPPAPLDSPEGAPLALLVAITLAVGVLSLRDPRVPEIARWRNLLRQSRQEKESNL